MLSLGWKYTLHCFRRGGCQHRYFQSSNQWSLAAVKAWGGWIEKEKAFTLIRYLFNEHEARYGRLNELHFYFTFILMQ
jgi:hypothetical protein